MRLTSLFRKPEEPQEARCSLFVFDDDAALDLEGLMFVAPLTGNDLIYMVKVRLVGVPEPVCVYSHRNATAAAQERSRLIAAWQEWLTCE